MIRSIAPNHNFSVYPILFCSRLPTIIRDSYHPFVAPTPAAYLPHKFAQPFPILLSESHTCFFPKIQAHTYFFLKIHISTPFTYPPPPHTLFNMFGLDYNQFQRLLCLILASVTHPSPYTFLRWSETIKQTSHLPILNIFEIIRRAPQESGEPYLKETEAEWKPETCIVKGDPFTFIW